MISNVTLTLSGPFALRRNGIRQSLHLAGNTRRLLVLLAAHYNRGLRRERLCHLIWPDAAQTRASAALNTGLWRIKSLLTDYPGLSVASVDDVVRFDVTDAAAVDVERLRCAVENARVDGGMPANARVALSDAVALCHDEYLEGESDHWALTLRESYAALHIEALTLLMRDAAENKAYESALAHGRRIVDLDPFREGSQREMMMLYLKNGQRVQAIRQYRALAELLSDELGISPMPETQALFDQILIHPKSSQTTRHHLQVR